MAARDIEVTLEGFQTWVTGDKGQIVDVEFTLGQNDKASNVSVILSDPLGLIAAALINHSIQSGGIQALPSATQTTSSNPTEPAANIKPLGTLTKWDSWVDAIIREAHKQGVYDKGQIAYMLATADGESGQAQYLVELWDGRGLQATYDGRLGNNNPGDGKRYRGRGLAQVTGKERYQYWSKVLGVDIVSDPDYMAKPEVAVPVLVRGMMKGEFTGRKLPQYVQGDKRDWYNARRVINGIVASQVQKYLDLANKYYAQIDQLITRATGGKTVEKLVPSVEPKSADLVNPEITPVKGSKLTISINGLSYEFIHQGTEHSDDGKTKVSGQSVRWVLNRRKRNKTIKNTSLKALAQAIANAHKIKLDWQASYDPQYEHIDQSGLSDYQLLVREANFAGLYVSDGANGTLTVKSRDKIQDSGYTVARGVNLISYKFEDKALDGNNEEQGSGLLQEEPKATVEPLTGQVVQKNLDIDAVKDKSATGKQAQQVAGTPKPGQDAQMSVERSRMKRIKGLPSQFIVPMTDQTLALKPLDAIRSTGFPEPLNRIWMVDKVTHKVSSNTSTLDIYSPVEVLDTTPQTQPTANTEATQPVTVGPGTWVYPTSGTVGSQFGMRLHPIKKVQKMHYGIDVANSPTPVVSVADGVCTGAEYTGGYGNLVTIKHYNGFRTRYAHLGSMSVRVGQTVKKGQQIGLMGTTGGSTGVHLHFELYKPGAGQQSNPAEYFPKMGTRGNQIIAGSSV